MIKDKYDKPFKLDMDFDEALQPFAQTEPGDVPEAVAEYGRGRPVQLLEDEAGGYFLIYATDLGVKLELRFESEPWLTQAQMAKIFGVDVRTVNHHIRQFLDAGELDDSVIRKFRITARDGKRYEVNHYGLDVAFYVGYRVNSAQGVLFRRWATDTLIQYATKGFAIDRDRLKDPGDQDRINELRDIIADIRASSANAYRRVREICAMCQDYDGTSQAARNFYSMMENKMLWAATSQTAPEIIRERADAYKPDVGLTYVPKSRPRAQDVTVANNYLTEPEARVKNRVTSMLLDYFEDQLDQGRLVLMSQAEEKLDGFIKFNGWPLLTHKGSVSRAAADEHAKQQLRLYKQLQITG